MLQVGVPDQLQGRVEVRNGVARVIVDSSGLHVVIGKIDHQVPILLSKCHVACREKARTKEGKEGKKERKNDRKKDSRKERKKGRKHE